MITMYSKDNCPWCERAISFLDEKDEKYTVIKIGEHITREEFLEQFPNVRTVPFFKIGGVEIPGYEALVEYINHPVRIKPLT